MKNYILVIATLFVFQNEITAQNKKEDNLIENETLLKVEYNEVSTYIQGIVNNDKALLYISDDFTFCKTNFNFDNSNSEKLQDKLENVAVIEANPEDYFSEIYVNRKENTLIEYLVESKVLKKRFAVEEKKPEMQWVHLDGRKKIGDYSCEKAKTTFRGRTYEVWYTSDIAVSSGPWKFNGLPGLILSVKDLEGIYSWEATSIKTIKNSEFNLSNYLDNKTMYTEISYKDFDEEVINAQIERKKVQKARTNADFEISFSTNQDKEPINEWRTQTYFEF